MSLARKARRRKVRGPGPLPEHMRRPGISRPAQAASRDTGYGVYTDDMLGGFQKVRAIASLVESSIIWRASYIAWNLGVDKAEPLLSRLIFDEGSQNPQAMDLLARVYFQQGKFEKARDLWRRAYELQPGNPGLRRTATLIESIAASPAAALASYRLGLFLRSAVMIALLCAFAWGGARGYNAVMNWSEGPLAVQNLSGRFHYDYKSITASMEYISDTSSGEDGIHTMSFTRRKVSSGAELGRIEVYVERLGTTLKATGFVPSLHVRYLVEQALWDIPGVEQVDLRALAIDRSYRVAKGESLWIIARRMFGDGAAWTTIARYNDIENPNRLSVGQELTMPLGDEMLAIDF